MKPTPERLVAVARHYLVDAANYQCCMHTRYSSAMNALGCLVTAHMAEESDELSVDLWEAVRYDPTLELDAFQLRRVIQRVNELLHKRGWKS